MAHLNKTIHHQRRNASVLTSADGVHLNNVCSPALLLVSSLRAPNLRPNEAFHYL